MSVTVTKAEGVTVFTMTSDPQSLLPPLCQILKNLCYSPVCCSLSPHLRRVQRNAQSVLGALHIMVGLLNVGLGLILLYAAGGYWSLIRETMFPVWIGALMILFGIVSILTEKFPSPCLVAVNVILNLAGVAFSITAIVLYSINIANIHLWWMCGNYADYYGGHYGGSYGQTTTTESPGKKYLMEQCLESKELVMTLLRCINAVLIVLSALELSLVISSAVVGIKALRSRQRGEEETGDPELYKPLVEEFCSDPEA
ncbi:tmem176a [Pungitius sinensis]